MRRLTLIRHAKSDWNDPDLSDFERPLNGRGKRAAPLMGQYLASGALAPDCLVSSPARRARKTARLIAEEIGIEKADILYEYNIYEAKVGTLISVINAFPDHSSPALIGHNPGLSELGLWLCPAAPGWLKTCAVLILELDIDSWSDLRPACGTIVEYTYPKKVLGKK